MTPDGAGLLDAASLDLASLPCADLVVTGEGSVDGHAAPLLGEVGAAIAAWQRAAH